MSFVEVILTEEQLKQKCAEWQKILRLQDWDVRTSIRRAADMKLKDANAEISVNVQHRLADITVLDPIDFGKFELNPQDMEKSLVHELLHIHNRTFTIGLNEQLQDAEEQAINMVAGALIQLYRKGGSRDDIAEA